jgi:hypothetical protein
MRVKKTVVPLISEADISSDQGTPRFVAWNNRALHIPPEEIADDGDVRAGCVFVTGRFPALR